MVPGDVILTRLPAAPGRLGGIRPALVVGEMPGYFPSILICGISSKVARSDPEWDVTIQGDDPSFATSGLRTASVVRPFWLATLPLDAPVAMIGRVDRDLVMAVRRRIVTALESAF